MPVQSQPPTLRPSAHLTKQFSQHQSATSKTPLPSLTSTLTDVINFYLKNINQAERLADADIAIVEEVDELLVRTDTSQEQVGAQERDIIMANSSLHTGTEATSIAHNTTYCFDSVNSAIGSDFDPGVMFTERRSRLSQFMRQHPQHFREPKKQLPWLARLSCFPGYLDVREDIMPRSVAEIDAGYQRRVEDHDLLLRQLINNDGLIMSLEKVRRALCCGGGGGE
ncbi:hypothetical protein ACHAPI_011810 [Fusarium lateritium]